MFYIMHYNQFMQMVDLQPEVIMLQDWIDVEDVKDVAICEFSYQAKSWQHSRVLKAMRSVKEYVEVSYLGE